jgi:hypothetical protein
VSSKLVKNFVRKYLFPHYRYHQFSEGSFPFFTVRVDTISESQVYTQVGYLVNIGLQKNEGIEIVVKGYSWMTFIFNSKGVSFHN